jgi:hypothetical protein
MESNEQKILEFLKECEIIDKKETSLENIYIRRNKLIAAELYDKMEKAIVKLKSNLSPKYIALFHDTTKHKQKWPLLNLTRRFLKINGFIMRPIRKSAGYTGSGKKKYDRYFLIEANGKNKDNVKNELNN